MARSLKKSAFLEKQTKPKAFTDARYYVMPYSLAPVLKCYRRLVMGVSATVCPFLSIDLTVQHP